MECSGIYSRDKTYTELQDTLKTHYKPQSLVIAERFRFYRRDQREREAIGAYIVALKQLARRCNFGSFLAIEDALRDRLVCGLQSETTQRRLLSEKDLTFQKACTTAQAMELAAKDTAKFTGNTPPTEPIVNRVATLERGRGRGRYRNSPRTSTSEKSCYRCGGKHVAQACWHKKIKCHGCSKVGHLRHMCKSKQTMETKYVESEDLDPQEEGESSDEPGMYYVEKSKYKKRQPATGTGTPGEISQVSTCTPKYTVEVKIGGRPICMEVDTGAVVSVASEGVYKRWLRRYPLERTTIQLRDYHGAQLKLKGVVQVPVQYERQEHQLPLIIVEGDRPLLLGRNILEVMKLNWKKICTIQANLSFDVPHQSVGGCSNDILQSLRKDVAPSRDSRPQFISNQTLDPCSRNTGLHPMP